MKKYIRDLLDDLTKKLDPPQGTAVRTDLDNQELSENPEERVRQLDQQAQEAEEREALE